MRLATVFYSAAISLTIALATRGDDYHDKYYSDPNVIVVERDGKVVGRLPCKRIPLDYPELSGRGEGHLALDSMGNIWAAVGYNVPNQGPERLFYSEDGGLTWTSHVLPPTKNRNLVAFTVLKDDTMLMGLNRRPEDLEIWASNDMEKTWKLSSTLRCAPFRIIGEGTMSLTQLKDGRILFPVARVTDPAEDLVLDKRLLLHSVYVSKDGGKTFPVAYSTFDHCCEAHIIELKSGKLLGVFRYQREPYPGETVDEIKALGGYVEGPHNPQGSRHPEDKRIFKHVFLGDSEDGGLTWKNFRPLRDAQGRPLVIFGECHGQLLQLPDGQVVLVHDHRMPTQHYSVYARISHDEGQTWDPEIYHLSLGRGLPSSVVLDDGVIVTVAGNTPYGAKGPITRWRAQAIRWSPP